VKRRFVLANAWRREHLYPAMRWVRWLSHSEQAPRTEGARAERSPTKR
jgi:hypothetical protein